MPYILHERAASCLLGQIAGDNLGALVEFKAPETIAERFPAGEPRHLVNGGVWHISAGQPTDDSEMALALARAIVVGKGWTRPLVAKAYLRWGDSHPFDMGGTTAAALNALRVGKPAPSTESQANGALMRAAPIGIAYAGRPDEAAIMARGDALLSHPHRNCVAANVAYCVAIATGISGGSRLDMINAAARSLAKEPEVAGWLFDAVEGVLPESYVRQMGWVKIAFTNAFAWLATSVSMEEAVVGTIRRGGDTDTNGAIVGALLGAAGAEVPEQWRAAIRACRPGPGTMKPRPQEYWPSDAEIVAADLVKAVKRGDNRA